MNATEGRTATDPSKPISWRYRLGIWLESHYRLGLGPLGRWFMLSEIARRTAHLSHVERNTGLRQLNAEVTAELEAHVRNHAK